MSDIVLSPVVSSNTNPDMSMLFKVCCNDAVVLIDVKKEFAEFLRKKDYDVDVQLGWHETHG